MYQALPKKIQQFFSVYLSIYPHSTEVDPIQEAGYIKNLDLQIIATQ